MFPSFGSMGQDYGSGMFGAPLAQQQHHGGGFNPLMFLSPMGWALSQHPNAALFGLSPALGLANILGAFK